ncbi:MAG: hypothetical protein GY810_18515 [Aureispira sp.]|nr:hypothetical protein [Aureispira sp.]
MEVSAGWLNVWGLKKILRFFLFLGIILFFLTLFFGVGFYPVLQLTQSEGWAAGIGLLVMFILGMPIIVILQGNYIPFYSEIKLNIEPILGNKHLQATNSLLIIDKELSVSYANIQKAYYYFKHTEHTDSETNRPYQTYQECLELIFDYDIDHIQNKLKYIPKIYKKEYVATAVSPPPFVLCLQCMVPIEEVKENYYKSSRHQYPTLELYGSNKQDFLAYLLKQFPPSVEILYKSPPTLFLNIKRSPKVDFGNIIPPMPNWGVEKNDTTTEKE